MSIKRIILLSVLGLFSYLLFLIVHFPASQAYALLGQNLPAQVYGISGTIWNGQAAVAQVQQQRLEALQWDIKPARLLLARLGADVQAQVQGGRLLGYLDVGNNSLQARDLRLNAPAKVLVDLAGIRVPARIDGNVDINLRELALEDGRLQRADGIVSWHQAMVNLGRPLPLGTINLRLEPAEAGATHGTLLAQDGPIGLEGDLNVDAEGRFRLDMTAQAREGADADALPAMRMLNIPEDGTPVRARLSGSLDGSGMRLEPLN